jgi:hypothetical protein
MTSTLSLTRLDCPTIALRFNVPPLRFIPTAVPRHSGHKTMAAVEAGLGVLVHFRGCSAFYARKQKCVIAIGNRCDASTQSIPTLMLRKHGSPSHASKPSASNGPGSRLSRTTSATAPHITSRISHTTIVRRINHITLSPTTLPCRTLRAGTLSQRNGYNW